MVSDTAAAWLRIAAGFAADQRDLVMAVADDDADLLRALADDADINRAGAHDTTMLHVAIRACKPAATMALLALGADVSAGDDRGVTPLHDAAGSADPAFIPMLLGAGADPDITNTVTGETPLVAALRYGRDEQFRALLAAGADPQRIDRLGYTVLHHAAMMHDAPHVLELLQFGADPAAVSGQGRTFQDYLWTRPIAAYRGEAKAARLAVRRWLYLNSIPVTGGTA